VARGGGPPLNRHNAKPRHFVGSDFDSIFTILPTEKITVTRGSPVRVGVIPASAIECSTTSLITYHDDQDKSLRLTGIEG
jgi:hypothetical protein